LLGWPPSNLPGQQVGWVEEPATKPNHDAPIIRYMRPLALGFAALSANLRGLCGPQRLGQRIEAGKLALHHRQQVGWVEELATKPNNDAPSFAI